jgi:hypothetical protein
LIGAAGVRRNFVRGDGREHHQMSTGREFRLCASE